MYWIGRAPARLTWPSLLRPFSLIAALALLSALVGCASSTYSQSDPGKIASKDLFVLQGVVSYSGEPAYLPRSIHASTERNGPSIKYSYAVNYNSGEENPIVTLSPLGLVGAPKAEDSLTVSGRLTVIRKDGQQKQFASSLVVSKRTTMFSEGDTYSQMRRKGLLRVRDLIDQKVLEHKAQLQAFLGVPDRNEKVEHNQAGSR